MSDPCPVNSTAMIAVLMARVTPLANAAAPMTAYLSIRIKHVVHTFTRHTTNSLEVVMACRSAHPSLLDQQHHCATYSPPPYWDDRMPDSDRDARMDGAAVVVVFKISSVPNASLMYSTRMKKLRPVSAPTRKVGANRPASKHAYHACPSTPSKHPSAHAHHTTHHHTTTPYVW